MSDSDFGASSILGVIGEAPWKSTNTTTKGACGGTFLGVSSENTGACCKGCVRILLIGSCGCISNKIGVCDGLPLTASRTEKLQRAPMAERTRAILASNIQLGQGLATTTLVVVVVAVAVLVLEVRVCVLDVLDV